MTKFTKGRRIDGLEDLIVLLQCGNWIYWNDRPKHPSWLWNIQLRTLRLAVNAGILYVAERRQVQEWKEKLP